MDINQTYEPSQFWEELRSEKFPSMIKETAKGNNLFIESDRENHPEYFKGRLWVNDGFTPNDRLDPWGISNWRIAGWCILNSI